jgi:hypothetical protein
VAKPLQQHLQPADAEHAVFPAGGHRTDIVELIMADHRRIRRLSEALYDTARCSGDSGPNWMLAHVWQRLADLLEAHTRAEEEICYPLFGCSPQAARRRREAIDDHEDIREAIREASVQRAGSVLWWRAVRAVLTASAGHLAREEREVLPHCLAPLTASRRRELGRQWSAFVAAWTLDAGPMLLRSPAQAHRRR